MKLKNYLFDYLYQSISVQSRGKRWERYMYRARRAISWLQRRTILRMRSVDHHENNSTDRLVGSNYRLPNHRKLRISSSQIPTSKRPTTHLQCSLKRFRCSWAAYAVSDVSCVQRRLLTIKWNVCSLTDLKKMRITLINYSPFNTKHVSITTLITN